MLQNLRNVGDKVWFEYHCNESHDSPDAPIWYRSHRQVEIIKGATWDDKPVESYTDLEVFYPTLKERGEFGMVFLYKVKFPDGLEWGVFEDELVDSPDEFYCETPPAPLKT